MNYKYSINTQSKEPIMLLDNEIGDDGINGAEFARELLSFTNAERIQVWINSIGGSIIDSYSIINAIRKSPIPVDTYNVGMAASSAFNIFTQGRKRYMMDYAQVMTHNAIGGGDNSENWNNSVGTIIASKSGKSLEEVRALMSAETYMNALDAVANGFADVIEPTNIKIDVSNDLELEKAQSLFKSAMLQVVNKVKIQTINNFNMKNVANKLGLNEAANEEQVLSAINKLEADKATAEAEAKNAADKLVEAENKLKEATEQLEKVANEAKVAAENALQEKAENAVKEAQKAGKITTGETEEAKAVINKWVNLFKADFEGTEALVNSLPVNKVSPRLPIDNKLNMTGVSNMANEMEKINKQTQNK